ncbi:MAG: hypothetical protein EOO04_33285, partial [Chitinophagaceae bacterium]
MKRIFLLSAFCCVAIAGLAGTADTVRIPLSRQVFHDKVDSEQAMADKADGKADKYLHVSKNEEINLQVTDVLFRKIDALQLWVETNAAIRTNNDKI